MTDFPFAAYVKQVLQTRRQCKIHFTEAGSGVKCDSLSMQAVSSDFRRLGFLQAGGFGRLSLGEKELLLMEKLNEYVKTAEAAAILGVSQNTLRAWAEAGKIPCRRNPANGYRLFLRCDLEAFLATIAKAEA
jgi:excisionase family DNA binding protein